MKVIYNRLTVKEGGIVGLVFLVCFCSRYRFDFEFESFFGF